MILLITIGVLFVYIAIVCIKGNFDGRGLLKQIKESEERYRSLVELSPEPIIVHDGQEILFVNEVCLKTIKASEKKDLIGQPIMNFIHPDSKEIALERMKLLRTGQQLKSSEMQIMTLDGTTIDVEIAGIGIQYNHKSAFQLVLRDISEQKRVKRELEDKQQRYLSLFEYNPDPVFSIDPQGLFKELNSSVWDILGYTKEELLHSPFHTVVDPQYLETVFFRFKKALNGIPQNYEIVVVNKNGTKIPANITIIPIIVDGKVTGVFGIAKDMTMEKDTLKKIEELAYTDQLTGLHNRTWFYKNLGEVINKSKKLKQSIAILAVDFDNFKNVNDTLGHPLGDLFLRQVSKRLKNSLRKNDTIARLGGDEFIITLEDVTKDDAGILAQRILKEMDQALDLAGHEIIVTLSIGISMYTDWNMDVETIMKQADLAMYSAKEKGKNNYQFFTDELDKRVNRKLQLENSLRRAIEQKELKLYYQPQVGIQTGTLAGFEALLRWFPSFGCVPPDEFIPIAEETGQIIPIGEWVITEACRQIKYWEIHNGLKLPISVNVSARQFKDPFFTINIKRIIQREQIDPMLLEIEITESVMLNVMESSKLIQELREAGIKIAIDDFGVGYSSIYLLTNLDFDTLKIDKTLLYDGIKNKRMMSILKAIIDATKTNSRIIVEGIETKEQAAALNAFNIIGQGYYYSHPLPPEQLEHIIKQMRR